MSQWKKVKIGDFLVQYRITIHVQDDQDYKQVTISSKDGVKSRGIKNGKDIGRKRQFLIDLKKYPKTAIFTRQGLHEGSIGIAPDSVDGCIATENMPMFAVNEDVINSAYLQYLLKSQVFSDLVSTLTPTGSAQKAIHERDLLPLEISIPELQEQKRIVSEISQKLENIQQLSNEVEKQKFYTKQLRANILQDAIEGKLTADWREKHPVKKGDPNYDAEALYEKIIAAKSKNKNTDVTQSTKTYSNWKLSALGNFVDLKIGGTPARGNPNYWKTEMPWVSSGEVANCEIFSTKEQISLLGSEKSAAKRLPIGTVLVAMIGQGKTRGQAAILRIEAATNQNVCAIILPKGLILSEYMYLYFCSRYEESRKVATGGNQAALSGTKISRFIFPLPPLAEQKEIVARVDKHLETITQLETQIATRETLTKQLMQGLLKDAFEEK